MITTSNAVTLTEDQFFAQFKPIQNHLNANASWDGCLFETYGEEHAFVRRQPDSLIWTVLDCDGELSIGDGYHWVNRLGYLIASVPRPNGISYDIACERFSDDEPWCWEEAFDKFGFDDGDGTVHTDDVAAVLNRAGYRTRVQCWGIHNVVILSIKAIDGSEQIPASTKLGYDDPRAYLPREIIQILDKAFPNNKRGAL